MTILADVLPILSAVSTVVGVVQQFSGAKQEQYAYQDTARYDDLSHQWEAEEMRRNSVVEAENAAAEEFAAKREAELLDMEQRRQISASKAKAAASGVATYTGSPLLAAWEAEYNAERNRLAVIRQGEVASGQAVSRSVGWYENAAGARQAGTFAYSAGMQRAKVAGQRATQTLLTGIPKAADSVYRAARTFELREPGTA